MIKSDNATSISSDVYDQTVRQIIPFYDEIISETFELVKTLKPDVGCWLDTGCGTGYMVELALPLFPGTYFVLADPSEAMLQQARKRFSGQPGKRVNILPVASEGLPALKLQNKPQVITAILSHHYVKPENRQKVNDACYQTLETNRVFITFEIIAASTPEGTKIGLERWKRYQVEHGRSSALAEEHVKRFNLTYFPITIREQFEALKKSGFRTVELFWLSHLEAGFYAIK